MLRYVTKQHYWNVLDSGIMRYVKPTSRWHLKDIQDAIAFSHIHFLTGNTLAEIGAGHSRILPALVPQNDCYAVDEYKGADGGPSALPEIPGVNFVRAKLGFGPAPLKDNFFDAVFSVSVLEHVANTHLPQFFAECWRILKPGGLMVHLIDAYIETSMVPGNPLVRRVELYRQPLEDGRFEAVGPIDLGGPDTLAFHTSYATNPDNAMHDWNIAAPTLRPLRESAQSCAIELAYRKKAAPAGK
jgi:SAM-dependent methyltransferase